MNQTVFNAYETFANVIPGMLVLLSVLYVSGKISLFLNNSLINQAVLIVVLIFLAFAAGLLIQGVSAFFEKFINNRKFGGYPSALYLTKEDKTFPEYFKFKVHEIAQKKFGVPLDENSNHVFELCYSYVMQKNISNRVRDFLRTYTFARNMMITMLIEAAFLFYLAYIQQGFWPLIGGLVAIGLSFIFYDLFLKYGQSFAKEVFRSFVVEEAPALCKA